MALLLGFEAPERGTTFASTGMPSQMPTLASFSCLSSLTVSLMPPSVPQTPPHPSYTLQDKHMLISISGCPSPRYFRWTSLSDFSQRKLFSSNVFLPCCHPGSAPCLLPSWHPLFPVDHTIPSLAKLVLRTSFHLFFFLTARNHSWNFLVSLAPCPCSFSYWSSF